MRHDGYCAARTAQTEPVGIYREIRPSGGGAPDLISGRVRPSTTSAIRARDNAPRLTSATTCHGSFNMKIHPHMLRHACGFKLANEGVDIDPAYSALHRAGTDSVQKFIPGLTAPAASFEATPAAPLPEARRIFQENLDECSMGPFFALKYLPR
jgi:hypothetical protein